jgi:hypothetical protein
MQKRLSQVHIKELSQEEKNTLSQLSGPWRIDGVPIMDIGDMIEFLSNETDVCLKCSINLDQPDTILESLWKTVQKEVLG